MAINQHSNTMLSGLQQRVQHAIRQYALCTPDDCLIVAVSGGADSVALLDLLATLPGYHLKLVVAHLNHQLRDEASDADEQFVQTLAERYGCPCVVSRCDVRQLAQQAGQSLEEAGRNARYDFFEATRQQYSAAAIAVAHHHNDQAETLLHRLIRGSGTTGLSAMAPRNQNKVIRPLLTISRQELRCYLTQRNLDFREDASNRDQTFLRNRIRHELLPLLDSYTPGMASRLTATAQLLAEDEALLAAITEATFHHCAETGPGWVCFERARLVGQLPALQARLFRAAITLLLGDLQRYERLHSDLLGKLLHTGTTGNRLQLPRGITAELTSNSLVFARSDLLQPVPPISCIITATGSYDLGNGLSLVVEAAAAPDSWRQLPRTEAYVAAAEAPFPWLVRPIIPGERFPLLGLTGSRALQDILTDLKLPRYIRRRLPLVGYAGVPLWLPGACRSRHALLSPGCGAVLRIALIGLEKFPLMQR